ncbi:MAG: hypothetical protein JWQ28_875, partial [Pedobacter sp.]|nr:hypothetical protein [Pedobacter sp.]
MQEKNLFEYAVIRVVPRVEREEFINVGVILYCAKRKYLKCLFAVDEIRLTAFCASLDIPEILSNINSIDLICSGGKAGGPIGQLDMPSRFRWLTATRSTVLQASKVHPGFCHDPEAMLF